MDEFERSFSMISKQIELDGDTNAKQTAMITERVNVLQTAINEIEEIAKFKMYGKTIMDGLTSVLTEKIDLGLLSDIRNDYLPNAKYDADKFKQDQRNDKFRD
jgi:hypothetical protein